MYSVFSFFRKQRIPILKKQAMLSLWSWDDAWVMRTLRSSWRRYSGTRQPMTWVTFWLMWLNRSFETHTDCSEVRNLIISLLFSACSLCTYDSVQPLTTAYNALDCSLETESNSLPLNIYSLNYYTREGTIQVDTIMTKSLLKKYYLLKQGAIWLWSSVTIAEWWEWP